MAPEGASTPLCSHSGIGGAWEGPGAAVGGFDPHLLEAGGGAARRGPWAEAGLGGGAARGGARRGALSEF